jgi:uncharacterized protein YaeQ
MSFIAGFFGFNLEISNTDAGVHERVRIKVPRHLEEPVIHFYARILAFVHCYQPGLQIEQDYTQPDKPTLFLSEPGGAPLMWVEVGETDLRFLRSVHRASVHAKFRVYLYSDEQLLHLCHQLRGSRTNLTTDIEFFRIPSEILADLQETETNRANWSVTIVDGTDLYLSVDDRDLFTSFEAIDVWTHFQRSIGNAV